MLQDKGTHQRNEGAAAPEHGQPARGACWTGRSTEPSHTGDTDDDPTVVAHYQYDCSGRLVKVTYPRSQLSTTYSWSGATTRITSVASAGMAATKPAYDTSGRLTQVSKEAPVAGGADVVTSRYVYDVATSSAGLPTVSDAVDAYRQLRPAVKGFAVFSQDYTGPVDRDRGGLEVRQPVVCRRLRLHRQHCLVRRGCMAGHLDRLRRPRRRHPNLDASAATEAAQ